MEVEICRADVATQANRIYPRHVLEAQIGRLRDVIHGRGFIGELDPAANASVV